MHTTPGDAIAPEELQAYLDGEADAGVRARVEAARARDPGLDEVIARDERMRARLRGAFDPVLDAPVPEALRALLEAAPPAPAPVVDLAAHRAARWRAPAFALAASLAMVAAAWVLRPADDAPWTRQGDALVARGALGEALDTALAAAPVQGVRVGLTFRDRTGQWCRSFDGADGAWQGVACRDGDAWRVDVLVRAPAAGGEVRQAGAAMAPEVLAAVDARIDGEAVDAARERALVDAGWRAP